MSRVSLRGGGGGHAAVSRSVATGAGPQTPKYSRHQPPARRQPEDTLQRTASLRTQPTTSTTHHTRLLQGSDYRGPCTLVYWIYFTLFALIHSPPLHLTFPIYFPVPIFVRNQVGSGRRVLVLVLLVLWSIEDVLLRSAAPGPGECNQGRSRRSRVLAPTSRWKLSTQSGGIQKFCLHTIC